MNSAGLACTRLNLLVTLRLTGFQVTTVVHPVVEHANHKDARWIGFEEDAVPAADGHLQAKSQVVAAASQYCPRMRPLRVSRIAPMFATFDHDPTSAWSTGVST